MDKKNLILLVNTVLEDNIVGENDVDEDLYRLGLESIGFIHLIVLIEEQCNITIPDEYLLSSEWNTINKMSNIIEKILESNV